MLTLLWLIPLLGALVVLLIPKRAEQAIKGVSLVATLLTFALTLVAFAIYVAPGSHASAPLRERVENNTLKPASADVRRDRGGRRPRPESMTWSSAGRGSPTSTSSITSASTGSASASSC